MKKRFFLSLCLLMAVCFSAYGQAKKPKLMIIPSRTWMTQNGFMTSFTNMSGQTEKTPDYQRAFDEDPNVSMIIGAMENFMQKEGYEVQDLKGALDKVKSRQARDNATTAGGGLAQSPLDMLNKTAKADINVELFFAIKKDGPYKYVEFNVSALDSYTNKPISTGNIGKGTPAPNTELVNQLGEAVLSFKDKFIMDMDRYYNGLFTNGRQIVVRCTLAEECEINYEAEFNGDELSQVIENWISENAMKGNYSLSDKTENEVLFDDVRIPMTYTDANGNVKGNDANAFGGLLRKYIESTTGVKCKLDVVGLGEVNIILGGKK